MSIHYNIIRKDKVRVPIRYVCFGLLNSISYMGAGDIEDSRLPRWANNYSAVREMLTESRRPSNIYALEFDYYHSFREDFSITKTNILLPEYEKQVKELIESFPMFKSIAAINVKNKTVRVKAVGQPADKVMFLLSIVRNMTTWVNRETGSGTNAHTVLKEKIPDFKQRMIFLFLFDLYRANDFMAGGFLLGVKPNFPNEYNLLNPATFGKKALSNLYSNDGDIEWFQKPFDESDNGYKRESHFHEDHLRFPGADYDSFRSYYHGSSPRSYHSFPDDVVMGPYLHRKLFDSLSLEDDEPLFDFCEWSPLVGFTWRPQNQENKKFDTDFVIEKYLALFEGL